jgi:predicted glycogen debranching enzyme
VIALGPDVVQSYGEASSREWLETNGRGGYAMGTPSGANTRRYHGLLSVPLAPPVRRFQLVNRLEESLSVGERRTSLSRQAAPGAAPDDLPHLREFRLDPFPVWIFEAEGVRLKKSFFLRYGEDTAVVLYEHVSGAEALLEVNPLLSGRDHHGLSPEDGRFDGQAHLAADGLFVNFNGGPSLHIRGGSFRPDPKWHRGQFYAAEAARGFDAAEDVFSPGAFRWTLGPGGRVALVMSTQERSPSDAFLWADGERSFRRELLERTPLKGRLGKTLAAAADQFLVARGDGMSVIAGYPWFEDWGRDAMIALPGLCLATGRADDAEKVLDAWTAASAAGRTPVRFSDGSGRPEASSVDASLWLVWAVQQYFKATRDAAAVRRWAPVLRKIIDGIEKGDRRGVHMDRDGLVQLPPPAPDAPAPTWMDAKVDGAAVTPRAGKPVEIQALWYNALEFLAELDLKLKEPSRGYEKLAAIARTSFNGKFWNERTAYPFDRLDGREKDPSIRPNALLAASLPYEILDAARFRDLVDRAERELLTPAGLRTLAAADAAYRGRHQGGPAERDRAYHQGTVWPWLLGPFCTAYAKAHGSSAATKSRLAAVLAPFRDRVFTDGALGTVNEVADGDAPHAPSGCPAQAWSVAEILRVLWEENIPL